MKKIKCTLYPLRFGNGNVIEAFTERKAGFELEVSTDTSIHREILTVDDLIDLKRQIINAMRSYDDFINNRCDTSVTVHN